MAGPMSGEVTAVPAASVIVVRDHPFELLMLHRHEHRSFMPNAWVFAGGMTEQIDAELAREVADGSTLSEMRFTAIRETFEETGIWLGGALDDPEHKRRRLLAGSITLRDLVAEAPPDLESLVWTSRWITPAGVPKRFDTYFFIAHVSRAAMATPEESEALELTWLHPAEALEHYAAGAMHMVFPTLRTLETLTGFDDAEALMASRRGAVIEPIQPILVNGKPTLP